MEVKIETARLAKKKGFKVQVFKYYDTNGMTYYGMNSTGIMLGWDWNSSFKERVSAPLQSQLQAWLREKHNIHMYTKMFHDSLEEKTTFTCDTLKLNDGRVSFKSPMLETYEDALEYALNEGLKLIEKK